MRGTYLHSPLKDLIIRNDAAGKGAFGSIRSRMSGGERIHYAHQGVDLVGKEFDAVYAPCDCQVIRIGYPYSDPDCDLELVELLWELGTMKLMYFKMRKNNLLGFQRFRSGEQIGELQSVSRYHKDPTMLDHIHWEVSVRCNGGDALHKVDPLMFFGKDDYK